MQYVHEDARLPGLRDGKGVAYGPQVYSLERTSAELSQDVLDFFDGDVPSLVDLDAYRLLGPFDGWGGAGPLQPFIPRRPELLARGFQHPPEADTCIPRRRRGGQTGRIHLEMQHALDPSRWLFEFWDEMGRAGPGGCVVPGPDVNFMVECVKRNVVV